MSICEAESEQSREDLSPDFVTQRQKGKQQYEPSFSTNGQMEDFRIEMRQLLTFYTNQQTSELREIRSTMKDIKEMNISIEASITELSRQNQEITKRLDQIERQVKDDRDYILFLENKLEEAQIETRKANIELKYVPKEKNETKQDLLNMIMRLSENLGCPINKTDIKDIYRVRGKNQERQNTPVIVETNSVLLKLELIKAVKAFNAGNSSKLCARHLGATSHPDTQVYVTEHLSAKGSRLHYLARDLRKSKGYKHCWTSYGKVYIRKSDDSPVILIHSESQVHSLFQD